MNIVLDAFGGDHAPLEMIKGAVDSLEYVDSEITLVGDKEIIQKKVQELYGKKDISEISERLKVIHSTEVISNEDKPTVAIRQKKDSSLVVGLNAIKKDLGDVFISAGSTGAVLTGALLIIGKIKGVDRPVIVADVPSYKQRILIGDAGANIKCKPLNFIQFAKMTNVYAQNVLGIKKPRIALLNIGVEETKGKDLVKESYTLLKEEKNINFIGNMEAREAFHGTVDILVCDGVDGNIFLKTVEGMGAFIGKELKEQFADNEQMSKRVDEFNRSFDYKEFASPVLLGINKPVLKIHGSSDARAVLTAIRNAQKFVQTKMNEKIKKEFSSDVI